MSVVCTRNGAAMLLLLLSDWGVCDSKSKGMSSDGGLELGKDSTDHGLRWSTCTEWTWPSHDYVRSHLFLDSTWCHLMVTCMWVEVMWCHWLPFFKHFMLMFTNSLFSHCFHSIQCIKDKHIQGDLLSSKIVPSNGFSCLVLLAHLVLLCRSWYGGVKCELNLIHYIVFYCMSSIPKLIAAVAYWLGLELLVWLWFWYLLV